MASVELAFDRPPIVGQPVTLVFNGEAGSGLTFDITVAAAMPGLGFASFIGPPVDLTIEATLPGLAMAFEARYISGAARPTVARLINDWQVADTLPDGTQERVHEARALPAGSQARHQEADAISARQQASHDETVRIKQSLASGQQQSIPVRTARKTAHESMLRGYRPNVRSRFQEAIRARAARTSTWQEMLRRPRPSIASGYQIALHLDRRHFEAVQVGIDLRKGWASRFQEAIQPQPRPYEPPVIPPTVNPCYTPDPDLVFDAPWVRDLNLVFFCENHTDPVLPGATVVVPIRRVYFVLNNVNLKRVLGNITLPTLALRMSLEADSWTWGFSATLPANQYDSLAPDTDGTPIELEATINGVPYRMLAEKLSRSRSFNQAAITVTGRGRNAILDRPYAPLQSFGNDEFRTSQQLMDDVLTLNGVSLGWDVDYDPDPWGVPAGAFAHQGSYMGALLAIAGAAGAYVQPQDTAKGLRVLSRYPVAPWEWGTVAPDFELPAAVTTQEGIEWIEKPRYNRVFVSGVGQGVLGQVTRAGTDGGLIAPLVTDPLITDVVAARERGRVVLSDTGRIAVLSLRLPVLPATGIIKPGAFVRYMETPSLPRVGLVRGTAVDAGAPEVWQTLEVETHG